MARVNHANGSAALQRAARAAAAAGRAMASSRDARHFTAAGPASDGDGDDAPFNLQPVLKPKLDAS